MNEYRNKGDLPRWVKDVWGDKMMSLSVINVGKKKDVKGKINKSTKTGKKIWTIRDIF